MTIHNDIKILSEGIDKAIAFATSTPSPPKDSGKKAYEAHSAEVRAHDLAGETFFKEEGPKLASAGFRVLAQFFLDINAIANGVNK